MGVTRSKLLFFLLWVAPLAAALGGCAQEEMPASLVSSQTSGGGNDGSVSSRDASAGTDAGGDDATTQTSPPPAVAPGTCRQTHAQSIPVRLRVLDADAGASSGQLVVVDDLLQRFQSICGQCHFGPASASQYFDVTGKDDFQSNKKWPTALADIRSDGKPGSPNLMPPPGQPNSRPYPERPEGDSVQQFAELLQAWIQQGQPMSFTFVPDGGTSGAAGGDGGAVAQFSMTPSNGNAMTNIGNCVPAKDLIGTEAARMDTLDAMFAAAQRDPTSPDGFKQLGLPQHLEETDLFTFDSHVLARYGVVAYAPGYPLWSDNAGKLRYVRVPRQSSIHFNKDNQQFEIPDNTRFYKTFLKPVVEMDNSIRWKKVETRLIVARKNPPSDPETNSPPSLFGTYRWNEDETQATLIDTPLRDGTAFADTLIQYVNDEPLASNVLAGQPAAPEEALLEAKAARHYAIPSAARCRECHRGSPSRDFVLGFTPLQINRRPTGFNGVIEDTGADELTQLQRLIDYGIISGVASLSDLLLLDDSQGTRKARNPYELTAQAYMLGNCAHCHNPHGAPSQENPVLIDKLNFLPGRPLGDPPTTSGGIFQFPLERTSPRIFRGAVKTVEIPYITPSLLDYPDPEANDLQRPFVTGEIGDNGTLIDRAAYAPWRSLIYRNVDNLFAYTDDLTLYPHMPRNTPGYDPRAKQFISDWMVSIPAVRTRLDLDEYAFQISLGSTAFTADDSIQPYVEVTPGAPGYDSAKAAAQARLDILHTGFNPAVTLSPNAGGTYSRYLEPHADATFDILDPAVLRDPVCHAIPPHDPNDLNYPLPSHAHWVVTDLTEPPGAWAPRRQDWARILVSQNADTPPKSCGTDSVIAAHDDEVRAIAYLSGQVPGQAPIRLDAPSPSIRDFAKTPVPFGVWSDQTCAGKLSGQQRVADLAPCTGGSCATHAWTDPAVRAVIGPIPAPALDPNAFVYTQPPGAAVFKMICINCHGPLADSTGRMAQNLATMTGGQSRVADFRDGFQGPTNSPMADMKAVFDVSQLPPDAGAAQLAPWTDPVTVEDRAARYLAWMALGGTHANVPSEILTLVGKTPVLGEQRHTALSGSANMLSNAKQICLSLLGPSNSESGSRGAVQFYPAPSNGVCMPPENCSGYFGFRNDRLIRSNGDAELWMKLCTFNNPFPVVHILDPSRTVFQAFDASGNLQNAASLIPSDASVVQGWNNGTAYKEAAAPVGDEWGRAVDPHSANFRWPEWPWCVDGGHAPDPVCPPALVAQAQYNSSNVAPFVEAVNKWAVRGAINAGLAVFVYLEELEKRTAPPPDYDQCGLCPSDSRFTWPCHQ
jgi:mono/diheme cytochrome c family protein